MLLKIILHMVSLSLVYYTSNFEYSESFDLILMNCWSLPLLNNHTQISEVTDLVGTMNYPNFSRSLL